MHTCIYAYKFTVNKCKKIFNYSENEMLLTVKKDYRTSCMI